MRAFASRTGTGRNLAALRAAGWHLFVSAAGVHRHEDFLFWIECGRWSVFTRALTAEECDQRYKALLAALGRHQLCEAIVAPDIVNGGMESWRLSLSWLDDLLAYDRGAVYLPVQPGIPTDEVARRLSPRVGVFIGGDSRWKEDTAMTWARLARERGALCHMGRVNSGRRLLIAKAAGCDSFDGSGPSRFEKHLQEMERARVKAAQLGLVLVVSVTVYDRGAEIVDVEVADAAPLDAILLAALDIGLTSVFEVQMEGGFWTLEEGNGWRFFTWDEAEETLAA